MNATIIVAVI